MVVTAPEENRDQVALRTFLTGVREAAVRDDHWKIAAITVETDYLDPLAVLEAIDEPRHAHVFFERPQEDFAVAGAEPVVQGKFSGPDRFAEARRFAEEVSAHTYAAGDVSGMATGPFFFAAFTFEAESERHGPFAPGTVLVPRWQVVRRGHRYAAVAQVRIDGGTDLGAETERIWRAHERFGAFAFGGRAMTSDDTRPVAEGSPASDDPGYCAAVGKALEDLADGRYQKIVLARRREFELPGELTPLHVADRLRNAYPSCTSFSLTNGAGTGFVGATPETLLEVRAGKFFTEALAGSAPRGQSATEDARNASALLHSDKDLREHRAVIDSIARRLGRLGIEAEIAKRPVVHKLPNVWHLRTPIAGTLPTGVHLLNVAGALHPTAAVGGVPREGVPERIRELEGFARGLYAGCLGWFDARGEGRMLVGLRSALVTGQRATLYAGAGIVAGSDPEQELAETETKFGALLRVLTG